ncbi:hypothetical protein X759_17955 [Mesorhizobium sp. LSHC420B00]|nr:hypothetical protein X759_17955 [Mesorhizobium sp. LSHC420B00]
MCGGPDLRLAGVISFLPSGAGHPFLTGADAI